MIGNLPATQIMDRLQPKYLSLSIFEKKIEIFLPFDFSNKHMTEILVNFPFDMYNPRASQTEIIEQIEKAIKQGFKFIIIQAPTGVGKSSISLTVGRHSKNAYICTPQKSLQDQYVCEFPEIKRVQGRKNHICLESKLVDEKGKVHYVMCDQGPCTTDDGFKCDRKPKRDEEGNLYWDENTPETFRCLYWQEKVDAIEADISCHNYAYLMLETKGGGDFRSRKFLIADEGHDLETHIINMIKVEITYYILKIIAKYAENSPTTFIQTDYKKTNRERMRIHIAMLRDILEKLPSCLERIGEKLKEKGSQLEGYRAIPSDDNDAKEEYLLSVMDERTKKLILTSEAEAVADVYRNKDEKVRYKKMQQQDFRRWREYTLEMITELNEDKESLESLKKKIANFLKEVTDGSKWIVNENRIDPSNKQSHIKSLTFQPLYVRDYAKGIFFHLGETVIIMSATILDHEMFAKDLGISEEEYYYLHENPIIPADRNKIFNLQIANFSSKIRRTPLENKLFWQAVVRKIDLILEVHANDKGIIHSVTTENSKIIKRYSKYSKRILIVDTEDDDPKSIKDRQVLIDRHCDPDNHEPTVICSPSLTEGIDLKDDLSRFQVSVKVPYPNLGNEWIVARSDRMVDPKFYDIRTARTQIQSIGRSLRSENDYCITYTLDTRYYYFMKLPSNLTELFKRHVQPLHKLKDFWPEDKYSELIEKIDETKMKKEKKRNY